MDYQVLFNATLGVAAFLGGWTLNNISKAIERLDQDVRKMPETYVAKTDYRDDMAEVKGLLRHISDKLDGKADK